MKSPIVKHSMTLQGHMTSVSVENVFWKAHREIAHHRHMTVPQLVRDINADRKQANLSAAIRLFVLEVYQDYLGPPLEPPKPSVGLHRRVS
jgi:predicted DNA-binding ribbon-helix-helix protein